MALNEIYRHGEHLDLTVPTGTLSGDPVLVGGSLPGVAQTNRDPDTGKSAVWLKGVHEFTVDGAANDGTKIYIAGDGSSRQATLTATATGNTLFGYAVGSKTATAAPLPVRIAQV